jgi:hypothetical protein
MQPMTQTEPTGSFTTDCCGMMWWDLSVMRHRPLPSLVVWRA